MPTPTQCVETFVAAWNSMDFPAIIDLCHRDIVYHNIPLPLLSGKQAVTQYLENCWQMFEQIDWVIVNIAANGDCVLTERFDNFVVNGHPVSLPVMGIFEINDKQIIAWRDYFDLLSYRQQLSAAR